MADILYGQYLSIDNFVLMSMYFKKKNKEACLEASCNK